MKFLRSRRGIAFILAILLALSLFRPGVHQLRNRIANSISAALGRRVTIDDVRFHVLPRPGFDLDGLIIYDAPAFSAEPMIRAQEVTAAIRLRSLLRGQIEIATLSATEPSINLVRNSEGRWNLASLIERNALIPAAPTQKSASERRPAFPYLEASNARINFKIGQTKKSLALVDATVALWQESENSWGARLRAQPVRTDFNLTDTGRVQLNATWQRAEKLRLTPMQVTIGWQQGQLGQITQLLTGNDQGWRGSVNLSANLTGTPEALTIESRAVIEGFRRYNVLESRNVRLATSCTGKYGVVENSLTDLLCESPVGTGALQLRGNIASFSLPPRYDLRLTAKGVPLASAAGLWHQVKQQLPPDLTATGTVDAEFRAVRNESGPNRLSGNGVAADVQVVSSGGTNKISLGELPLTLIGDTRCCQNEPATKKHSDQEGARSQESTPLEAHLRIGPSSLVVNSSAPISSGGWISASGYRFFLRGDTELKNLFHLEDAFGVPATRLAAEGDAKLDLSISGSWRDLTAPVSIGTAQLHNVHAEVRGLNAPIELGTAFVSITPDTIHLGKISARVGTTHWTGEVTAPRHCGPPSGAPGVVIGTSDCTFQFDLAADELSASDLAQWFTPPSTKRPWYRILSPSEPQSNSSLMRLEGAGYLRVGRFLFKKLTASQVSSRIEIQRGKIILGAIRGQLLQGQYQGRWSIEASQQPVTYHGSGALQEISLTQLSDLMNDPWIAGIADGTFDLDGSGASFHDVLANFDGSLHFLMRNGAFTHVEIPGAPTPLPVHRFSGDLRLKKGAWELSGGKLESRDGIYRVSGTASPGNLIDFTFIRGDEQSWRLTGTLARPRVAPASRAGMAAEEAHAQVVPKP